MTTKNVYIVLTEYQLLQALNIATSIYSESNFINRIYVVRNGKRLNGIDTNKRLIIKNTDVKLLDNYTSKQISDTILKEKPDHFLFFQGNSPLNIFLGYTFSKKGKEVSLGPDGYGAYNIFEKKHYLLSVIKDSLTANKFLIKNSLFNGKIFLFNKYRYGNYKFINNLWVTHPNQYIHRSKNSVKVKKLPYFNNECVSFIKECFGYKSDHPISDVIYYFNQPLWSDKLVEIEINFLKEVFKQFPGINIIIKLHPLTSLKTRGIYEKFKEISIIDSSVPAEVILISLKNCIILTGWSSVLLTENKTCNYYFNYPIFKQSNEKLLNQSNLIVLDHIKMITSPKEMFFKNE